MKRRFQNGIISAVLLVAACTHLQSQSNVYSLGIHSGGVTYWPRCSLTLPFYPFHYKVSENEWREDKNGLTYIDVFHKSESGDKLCRTWDVEYGSESFTLTFEPVLVTNIVKSAPVKLQVLPDR